ncbi:serine/arginine repetitive matrix protein 3-like [Pipra filicauda]|uniref:Serine/arginine repetitive matrix protein 3-like n=1 Tax=Pipra filicauda TaxID=649802 RepID=A0A7R5KT23_9PASS|nr:serine/arginine repetitive matrix protein 3-like [Pipra filicauda]
MLPRGRARAPHRSCSAPARPVPFLPRPSHTHRCRRRSRRYRRRYRLLKWLRARGRSEPRSPPPVPPNPPAAAVTRGEGAGAAGPGPAGRGSRGPGPGRCSGDVPGCLGVSPVRRRVEGVSRTPGRGPLTRCGACWCGVKLPGAEGLSGLRARGRTNPRPHPEPRAQPLRSRAGSGREQQGPRSGSFRLEQTAQSCISAISQ